MTTVSVSSARSVSGARGGVGMTPGTLAVGAAALALITAMFWTFLAKQARHSWATEDWSHSFFVPVISVYLLYQGRARLREAARGAGVFLPGLVPMLLGMVIYPFFLIGYPNHMGQGWSWVLTVYGATLLFMGPRVAAVALLPIGYLLMGVTVSERVMVNATFQLQLLASQGAYVLLNVIGVTTDVRGNVLEVHTGTGIEQLNVAEACSGMRLVIAFVALGVAVALVGLGHWWQRVTLMLSAVPVALGLNIVRVAVLGVLTLSDPEYARGGAHMLIGTVLLVPGFFIFMGLAWALSKVIRESGASAGPEAGVVDGGVVAASRGGYGAWVGLVALGLGALLTHTVVAALGYTLTKLPIEPPGGRGAASRAAARGVLHGEGGHGPARAGAVPDWRRVVAGGRGPSAAAGAGRLDVACGARRGWCRAARADDGAARRVVRRQRGRARAAAAEPRITGGAGVAVRVARLAQAAVGRVLLRGQRRAHAQRQRRSALGVPA